jgi:NADPH:quinone reductase-like Zn-dependent oxidoreductase
MESMKAAVLTAFGDAEKFELQTVPIPTLKAHQVLVRSQFNSLKRSGHTFLRRVVLETEIS